MSLGQTPTKVLKQAVNVTVNKSLLEAAREFKINLSKTLDASLTAEIKRCREEQWLKENKKAIEEYNRFVEKHGVFSDGIRSF